MTIDKALNDELRARFNPDGSQLRAVQLRLLDMLKRFDALCRKHGIKYWLSSGTCLGAMRHGGFIPWDDDVDIDIEYSDFRRLRRILRTTPPEGFAYQDRHSDPEYVLTFPKLRDLHSHIDELNRQDRRWRFQGCYIDIFPLVHASSLKLHVLARRIHHLTVRRAAKIKRDNLRKLALPLAYSIYYGFANPIFRIAGYLGTRNRRRHMPGTWYPGARDARDFREVKYVPFEDTLLPVPANVDAYLTRIFGDWKALPDPDSIETHINRVTLS